MITSLYQTEPKYNKKAFNHFNKKRWFKLSVEYLDGSIEIPKLKLNWDPDYFDGNCFTIRITEITFSGSLIFIDGTSIKKPNDKYIISIYNSLIKETAKEYIRKYLSFFIPPEHIPLEEDIDIYRVKWK